MPDIYLWPKVFFIVGAVFLCVLITYLNVTNFAKAEKKCEQAKKDFAEAQKQWIAQVKPRGSVYMQLVEGRTDIYKAMYLANNTYFFVTLEYFPQSGTFVEIESDIISNEARIMLGQTMKLVVHI